MMSVANNEFGSTPAKAITMNNKLSTSSPTSVEPIVRVHNHRPCDQIFILARINELENSPQKWEFVSKRINRFTIATMYTSRITHPYQVAGVQPQPYSLRLNQYRWGLSLMY